jgi:hypothetical protein
MYFENILHSIADRLSERKIVAYTYAAFAGIFIFYGFQKLTPWPSPVYNELTILANFLGVENTLLILVVGLYEIVLGFLFLMKLFNSVALLFIPHQIVGFANLLLFSENYFTPPWVEIGVISVPLGIGSFSAFVLKNLIFISSFLFLLNYEFSDKTMDQ